MPKQLLFIHGAGEGAYQEDAKLVDSLRQALGTDYVVVYPAMPHEADAPYGEWKQRIEKELGNMAGPVILAAHSVGGSTLLKCLGEIMVTQPVVGVFIMAAPFWGGDGWHYEGYKELEMPAELEAKLPEGAPVFLYHCQDDEIVPAEHLALYQELLPQAKGRLLEAGGHQFNNDLTVMAEDIKGMRT